MTVRRLPVRFPVGTRYVVEGEPSEAGELRITSRYLVLPSGTRIDVTADGRAAQVPRVRRSRHWSRASPHSRRNY